MRNPFKIIFIVLVSLITLGATIMFFMWIFTDPFNWIADKPDVPNYYEVRSQCIREKSDIIYERYQQCVKDAGGNNVRCRDTAIEITCH